MRDAGLTPKTRWGSWEERSEKKRIKKNKVIVFVRTNVVCEFLFMKETERGEGWKP